MAGNMWQPHREQRVPTLPQSRGRGLCTLDAKVLQTQNKTALFRATTFTKDYNEEGR
jgi:hypothetical protein